MRDAGSSASALTTPKLSLIDQTGQSQQLSDYQGRIIVVLNFWATWCGPCRDELPILSKLADKYSDKGVVFIAASIDDSDTQPKIPEFLRRKKITNLPIWVGATSDTLKRSSTLESWCRPRSYSIRTDKWSIHLGRILQQRHRFASGLGFEWPYGKSAQGPAQTRGLIEKYEPMKWVSRRPAQVKSEAKQGKAKQSKAKLVSPLLGSVS